MLSSLIFWIHQNYILKKYKNKELQEKKCCSTSNLYTIELNNLNLLQSKALTSFEMRAFASVSYEKLKSFRKTQGTTFFSLSSNLTLNPRRISSAVTPFKKPYESVKRL